jgi:hypothetical protein
MPGFWTRTRRYMAAVWLGTALLEAIVLYLAHRTNDSWFLLLAAAVLILPLVGWELTDRWLKRPKRKRWKRHDLEDAAKADAAGGETVPPPSAAPRVEP